MEAFPDTTVVGAGMHIRDGMWPISHTHGVESGEAAAPPRGGIQEDWQLCGELEKVSVKN